MLLLLLAFEPALTFRVDGGRMGEVEAARWLLEAVFDRDAVRAEEWSYDPLTRRDGSHELEDVA